MAKISRLGLFGAYLFRWIGFSIEPDVIKVGNPDQESPVILTCNFTLTVKRVLKAIKGLDCYLLIAPSKGINVWCGACGDDFNTDSVISIIKTSGINKMVSHRTLIIPQLSAPGIDPVIIKKRVGWDLKFGPVYAKDIKKYIENNFKKTEAQRRVNFPLKKRIEMANLYFFSLLLLFSIIYWITAIFLPILDYILYFDTIILAIVIIYGVLIILPSISSKTGKLKVLIYGLVIFVLLLFYHINFLSDLFYLIWNCIVLILLVLILAEDFHGLTPIYKSEVGARTWNKGKKEMKVIFGKFKLQPYGAIQIKRDICIGCQICIDVCPRDVYSFNASEKKADLIHPHKCINCNACVNRCLAHCIKIV